jgi:hypothetical protein
MRRMMALLAGLGLSGFAAGAGAQPAWLAGGPYLEPQTGAAILFGPCPEAIDADRICTIAGWHDDTPLPGSVAQKACGSMVLVETAISSDPPALVVEARGVLAKARSVRLTPGPLDTLVALVDYHHLNFEWRTFRPVTRIWVPAHWGWSPCDASPTS